VVGTVTFSSPGTAPTANVAGSPYPITPSNATGGTFNPDNYAISYTNGFLMVIPAALLITPTSEIKPYGESLPSITTAFTATGLQNGETVGTIDETSLGLPSTAGVGQYQITANDAAGGTFDPANYSITYAIGATITITQNPSPMDLDQIVTNTLFYWDNVPGWPRNYTESNVIIGEVIALSGNLVDVNDRGIPHTLKLGDSIFLGDKIIPQSNTSNTDIKFFTNTIVHVDEQHPYTGSIE